jgi:hypothetical protein
MATKSNNGYFLYLLITFLIKKSQNRFFLIFLLDPEQNLYLWLTEPDPGGPKTYRSGSTTLLARIMAGILKLFVRINTLKTAYRMPQRISVVIFSKDLCHYIETSVADPWHFGVDPDPDPRIHASD